MHFLITAAMASQIDAEAPGEIIYIPEGEHTITPWVDGKAKTITVKVPREKGEAIAAKLQASLGERLKSNVRPWFDFMHKAEAASGHPKSFRYGEIMTRTGPARGIIVAMDWSGSGKKGIEDRDFSYLSPTFLMDEDGTPSGLPERGPLAGLLNEPAFREIPRIAASDAAVDHEPTKPPVMSKLIFAALAISAAAENAETEAVKAIDKLKVEASDAKAEALRLKTENEALTKKVEAAEAEAKKTRKDRAETLVKAAVADGRIAPKDEEKQTKFRDKIEAGDTFAEEILAQLPKINQGLDKPIVMGTDGKPVQASDFEGKAKALVTAGQAKTIDEAFGLVAASDPTAYNDYLATLKG